MTPFIVNTFASPPDQRDIPFVPRSGIAIADQLNLLPGLLLAEAVVAERELAHPAQAPPAPAESGG